MHILMIRFSSMGDVVLQTATLNWLRALYGAQLRMTFVTSKEFASLVNSHPSVDDVVVFDRRGGDKLSTLKKKITEIHRQKKIDLIIDMHATLRSFMLRCLMWTIPALVIDKRRWERFLLTKIHWSPVKKLLSSPVFGLEPQVVRCLRDFEDLFGDTRSVKRTQAHVAGPHGELTTLGKIETTQVTGDYIVLAPSASFVPKRWHIDSFVSLARKLLASTNVDIVVLAGPEDSFCEAFNVIEDPRLKNLQGKTSLRESMTILSGARLCVGNDSGMNHIAEAYGVPCITLFGPTDPFFGFAPHGSKSQTISKDLWCKPCSTTGKKPCFRERHFCMEMITVEEVFTSTMKLVETV
jgi:ADP-heptose:LPS heptosyltransferase